MNYTFEPVSSLAIAGMVTSGVISLLVPLGLMIFWRKKTGAKLSSFILGCTTFFLFAMVLERFFHSVVLDITGTAITGNPILYALYGGLAAGIFEEFGRRFAMKACMQRNLHTLNKENAIMYGIGHGGIEAILVCGLTEISNVSTSLAINKGGISAVLEAAAEGPARDTLYQQLSALWTYDGGIFFAAGVERLSAIVFHICASYLVYKAVSDKKAGLFVLAVALHAVLDAATLMLSQVGSSIWVIELVAAAFSIALIFFTVKDYKNRTDVVKEEG